VEKQKNYNRYAEKYQQTVQGVRGVSHEEEKEGVGFAEKEGFKPAE